MNALMEQEYQEIEEMEERQHFQVTDLSSLNWVFRKLAALEAKRSNVNKLANMEVARIEMYRESELKKLQRDDEYFHGLVVEYAFKCRAVDPKFSEKTPYGSLSFRKQQPKWHYDDEKLVQWLEENEYSELVRIKKEPVKADIKKDFFVTPNGTVIDANGQRVEGASVEMRDDEIVIKPEV